MTEDPKDAGAANVEKATAAADTASKTPTKTSIKVSTEGRMVGTRMELDGIISPDGVTLEMNLVLEHHYAPPTRRSSEGANPAADSSTIRVTKAAEVFHFAKISSSFTMKAGTTRIVGTWKPEGAPEDEGKDVMQVAFVRAAITRAE